MSSSALPPPRVVSGPLRARRRADRLAARLEARAGVLAGCEDAVLDDVWSSVRAVAVRADRLDGEMLVEALAVVSVCASRVLGLRPYPVQRLGALVLATGSIAEMRTGEGKTLSTALAALSLAAVGRGVHVATANEYLASRDAGFVGPLAARLGLSVGVSRQGSSVPERLKAHAADVTYGTSSSFGFDYLYDNLALLPGDVACRAPFAALVDEADSVLLDEAVTPLLVSVSGQPSRLDFGRMADLVGRLVPGRDVYVDPAGRFVSLLDSGTDLLESSLADRLAGRPLHAAPRLVAQVHAALDARFLLVEGVDYLVVGEGDDAEVVLVDANTGRRRVSSRLRSGLHEALEAKEGLRVRPGGVTRAAVSVQGFFSRYPLLGGMTGTASSAAEEFAEFYGLNVLTIPTHRPSRREDLPDRVFASGPERDEVLLSEVASLRASGRPVLVACESVIECARVGDVLSALSGPPPRVLSARDPDAEAAVLSRAGEPSAVTVATAMAGRGVDIVLGGSPSESGFESRRSSVVAAGGLAVVSTCRYPSRRVDMQLRGRAGRQGEPGSSLFLLSFDEELPRRYTPGSLVGLLESGGELPRRTAVRVFDRAQAAQSSEHVASRREVVRADGPLAAHREAFYSFRSDLLARDPWERVVSVVRTGLARRLASLPAGRVPSAVDFDGLWPSSLVFPSLAADAAFLDALTDVFVGDLVVRLGLLAPLESSTRADLLARTAGALVLDALDLVWAGHLESATGLYEDTRLVSRTGQDPDRVYRTGLRASFETVFERFFSLVFANLAGLRITGVTGQEVPAAGV